MSATGRSVSFSLFPSLSLYYVTLTFPDYYFTVPSPFLHTHTQNKDSYYHIKKPHLLKKEKFNFIIYHKTGGSIPASSRHNCRELRCHPHTHTPTHTQLKHKHVFHVPCNFTASQRKNCFCLSVTRQNLLSFQEMDRGRRGAERQILTFFS